MDKVANGYIYEFFKLEPAKTFAAAVKARWHRDAVVEVLDAEITEALDLPSNTIRVEVARDPSWFSGQQTTWEVERQMEELAETFGGEFIGT
jgi:hypothetical protein